MDITISTSELRAALTRANGITADKKGTLPILSTALLEAEITPEGGRSGTISLSPHPSW